MAGSDVNMDSIVQRAGGFDSYLTTMTKPGTWGDGVTLAGAALLYRKPINVICNNGSAFKIDGPPATSAGAHPCTEPVYIGYSGTTDSIATTTSRLLV